MWLCAKFNLHRAVLSNLAQRGSENWSGNKEEFASIKALHHKSIRRTLGASIVIVKEEVIASEEVQGSFYNVDFIACMQRNEQLIFRKNFTS